MAFSDGQEDIFLSFVILYYVAWRVARPGKVVTLVVLSLSDRAEVTPGTMLRLKIVKSAAEEEAIAAAAADKDVRPHDLHVGNFSTLSVSDVDMQLNLS